MVGNSEGDAAGTETGGGAAGTADDGDRRSGNTVVSELGDQGDTQSAVTTPTKSDSVDGTLKPRRNGVPQELWLVPAAARSHARRRNSPFFV